MWYTPDIRLAISRKRDISATLGIRWRPRFVARRRIYADVDRHHLEHVLMLANSGCGARSFALVCIMVRFFKCTNCHMLQPNFKVLEPRRVRIIALAGG